MNDFVRQLYKDGSDESIKLAKNLSARQRFFAPVLVRGEEAKGVRLWGFGKTAYRELLNLVLNPEYGDITDPESGTDLVIGYGKPAGASFPETKITPRRKSSPLHKDSERVVELMENIPDFEELFENGRKTPDEVQDILAAYLDSEEASEEVVVESATPQNSVDKAFSELVG